MQQITYRNMKLTVGSQRELQAALVSCLTATSPQQIVTVNPEYIVLAQKNLALTQLTQRSAYSFIDGVGLMWALYPQVRTDRYTGADAVQDLCRAAAQRKLHIGVLVPPHGLSQPQEIQAALTQRYPGIACTVWVESRDIAKTIAQAIPDILFVTTGQPHQDIWIADHKDTLRGTKVAIGVGGALDFLTGARRRAPRLFRQAGLEWLWRLAMQPWRLSRILRATFGFWYTILFR